MSARSRRSSPIRARIAAKSSAILGRVDPTHAGINSYMMNLFKQYPAGNDPKSAADGGLNFNVLRFNAPQKLDNRAYVGKLDFNLDPAGKHTLMLRGTLAGNANDSTLAHARSLAFSECQKRSRGSKSSPKTIPNHLLANRPLFACFRCWLRAESDRYGRLVRDRKVS